ncbi:MAG TPA: WbqC family protein [Verrucomicrobiae bacterium]|nr:WbqC family protein [Verrucomicrobiae bacterium]
MFNARGIHLVHQDANHFLHSAWKYFHTFVPNLSITDVMMFNSVESIQAMLGQYDLV